MAAAIDDGRIPEARARDAAARVAALAAAYPAAAETDGSRPDGSPADGSPAEPDAATVRSIARALAEASTADVASIADAAEVRDGRRGPSMAVATRARPVVEWLSEATTRELAAAPVGPGRIIVVADRLDDDQRAVIAAAQAQGAAVVVNVGPIGATAPHPTVELGADSPLSVRVLQEWLGGAVR